METLRPVFFVLLTLPTLAFADFKWSGSAQCSAKKFESGQWVIANPSEYSKKPIQKYLPPQTSGAASRFTVSGIWYSAPATCFTQVANAKSNRKIASVGNSRSTSNQKINGVDNRALDTFDFVASAGLLGQTRSITSTAGTAYDIKASIVQLDLGFNKTSVLTGNFGWGYGAGVAIGSAKVEAVNATLVTYDVENQMAYTGRVQLGFYYQLSDTLRFGLEPGVMYSSMSLPAPDSTTLTTPASGLTSIYWQINTNYKFSKDMGFNASAGMNQVSKQFMASVGLSMGF